MDRYDISDFFSADDHYHVTYFSYQRWNSGNYSYLKNPRPDHGILLVTQGSIEFVSENVHMVATPGDMIFLPQGSYYEAVIRPEFGETRDYLINFTAAPRNGKALPAGPLHLFRTKHGGYVELFARAIDKKIKDQLDAFGRKRLLFTLLENLAKEGKNSVSQKELPLENAQDMLAERKDLSIAQIAKSLGISESGFRSLFKKAFGLSPAQYRMHIRINQAKHLLESTEMTVSQIAEALDFYDEAYFCKIFRKYTGISPKKYSHSQKI